MADQKPVVGIIMGSKSDLGVMEGCTAELEALGVPYELVIASAHRTPAKVHEWASTAADRGIKVIIAAAGKAAHLGGVVAAFTPLPVIGVPMKTSDLGGMDSLLSMVQMPSGVPVACVAINGAKNAAIYATQILGACDPEYRKVIEKMKQEMADARRSAVSPQYKESHVRLSGKTIQGFSDSRSVEAGCCPCGTAGSDILSSAAAHAAPRDTGDASSTGRAGRISTFIL